MATIEATREPEPTDHPEDAGSGRNDWVQLVADNLPVFISYVDSGLIYQFCNQTYGEWTGLTTAEVRGRHVRDVLGDGCYFRVLAQMQRGWAETMSSRASRTTLAADGTGKRASVAPPR